ncbi:armadillo repeat-containing protein 6-like [Haliotis cracherodii]|uniref:armadillo repeat-containing protein 6-like n=1 Tax=Haliotis cracherodii TaxID=6455 RepID=UPI0039ECED52
MAKQITQETFDDVVKENMEDFDMAVEDAIEDAVQQFQTQGVSLDNIVKDGSLYSGGGGVDVIHPVIKAVQDLSLISDDAEAEQVTSMLSVVQSECDVDLSHRCLAGSNNAYPVLVKMCRKYEDNPEILTTVLKAFCSLVNGQPDLLDEPGSVMFTEYLRKFKSNADLLELVIRAVRLMCIKHEGNRQNFVSKDIIVILSELLDESKKSPGVVKETCTLFRVLTNDDDVRVPFGKAHDHAKMIVTEGNALERILNICKEYENNSNIQSELFSTLARLAVRDEFCNEVNDLGGLKLILQAFEKNLDEKNISKQALVVLKALAGNDNVKKVIVKSGGVELILAAMTKHQANASIAESACSALATVVLRNPVHVAKVMECVGYQQIVQAMKIHKDEQMVQKQACMALRNLVARTRDNCQNILEQGAEALINDALHRHSGLEDEAKAALRDLGCKVELKERWKGEKGQIVH